MCGAGEWCEGRVFEAGMRGGWVSGVRDVV